MIWVAISQNSSVVQHGRFNIKNNQSILADHAHMTLQMLLPDCGIIFQDDDAQTHKVNVIQNLYKEHKSEIDQLDWLLQSPDLNIIKCLWGILKQ